MAGWESDRNKSTEYRTVASVYCDKGVIIETNRLKPFDTATLNA